MPEYPDIEVYREAIEARFVGQPLERIRVASPFLVRTHQPPLSEAQGKLLRIVGFFGPLEPVAA